MEKDLLSVRYSGASDTPTVEFEGRLTVRTRDLLQRGLRPVLQCGNRVTFDLRKVEVIDLDGLNCLNKAFQVLQALGRTIHIKS